MLLLFLELHESLALLPVDDLQLSKGFFYGCLCCLLFRGCAESVGRIVEPPLDCDEIAVQFDFAGLAVLAEEQMVDTGHPAAPGVQGDTCDEAGKFVIWQRDAMLGV